MGKRWRQFSRHASEGLFPIQWNGSRSVHGALWKMRLCVHAANCQSHFAAGQLSQRRKTIRRLGARIAILNPEQLHRLRIQVKKARYSIEFFSGLFHGKECANRCKTIKSFLVKLQDSLGKLNDIVTHKTLFGDIIARPTKGLTGNHHRAFAAGPIIGDQQAKVQKSLDRARKAYSRFDRAKAFWKVTDPKQHVQASSVQESTEQ